MRRRWRRWASGAPAGAREREPAGRRVSGPHLVLGRWSFRDAWRTVEARTLPWPSARAFKVARWLAIGFLAAGVIGRQLLPRRICRWVLPEPEAESHYC